MWNSASYLRPISGLRIAVVSLGAVFASDEARAVIVVDNFQTTQAITVTSMTGAPISHGVLTGPNSIGGAREAVLNVGMGPTADHTLLIDHLGDGLLTLSFTSVDAPRATLNYLNATSGNVMVPGLAADLSSDTVIEFSARATENTPVNLFVYTSDMIWSQWNFLIPGNGLGMFETTSIDLATASPVVTPGGGAILSSVAAISVVINGGVLPSSTVQLDYIQATAVPEPSAVVFASVVLLCVVITMTFSLWLRQRRDA